MSKISLIHLAILFLVFGQSKLAFSREISLTDAFNLALKENYAKNENEMKIKSANETIVQGRSAFFPKIALKGTYNKQENLNDSHYANLNMTYNLYRGGKDSLAIDAAKLALEASKNNGDYNKINVYQTLIPIYYNLFLYSNDAKNLTALLQQSQDRVFELEKRVAIGRSRPGELLQAKSQLAQVRAQIENNSGSLEDYRKRFEAYLGGIDLLPIIDINESIKISTLDELKKRIDQRGDLKSKELKISEADIGVSSAFRGHFPTLDLTSNYYLTDRTGTSYSKTTWDIGLVLSFPLFEGGSAQSKVNEQVYKKHEARFSYMDYKKSIELDLISKYETLQRYIRQVESLEVAEDLSLKSYNEALKDYRLGMVSNLEVISAMNLYIDSKRASEKNKIMALMTLKLLSASVGELP